MILRDNSREMKCKMEGKSWRKYNIIYVEKLIRKKIVKKKRENVGNRWIIWPLIWLNINVTIINITLQLLYIYIYIYKMTNSITHNIYTYTQI